jgi:sulfur-carrier protein
MSSAEEIGRRQYLPRNSRPVKVILYATLRAAVGLRMVELGPEVGVGSSVWDAVHALIARHPVLGSELLDENGHLSRHVHVMVNGRDAPYLDRGLDTPLGPDDTLDVFPPVGGG